MNGRSITIRPFSPEITTPCSNGARRLPCTLATAPPGNSSSASVDSSTPDSAQRAVACVRIGSSPIAMRAAFTA